MMKNPLFVCPNCDSPVDQVYKKFGEDSFLYTKLECSTCGHRYEVRYPIEHKIADTEYWELLEYGDGMSKFEDTIKWRRE